MASQTDGLNFHIKKKILQNQDFPTLPPDWQRFMDKAIYFFGVFGPLMTIPQVTKIWVEKNAAGVSVISWSAYLLAAGFWLIYGISHKVKPIIVAYSMWIVLEIFIVTGIFIYG